MTIEHFIGFQTTSSYEVVVRLVDIDDHCLLFSFRIDSKNTGAYSIR
jgi:hypothetical protein